MKEREELELILKLIGKYNLPLSPILEYAVKEKMEEYPEDEQTTEIVKEGWAEDNAVDHDDNDIDILPSDYNIRYFCRTALECLEGQIEKRSYQILNDTLKGESRNSIAKKYGLTQERIRQIIVKTISIAKDLLKEQHKNLEETKVENAKLNVQINLLKDDNIGLKALFPKDVLPLQKDSHEDLDAELVKLLDTPIKYTNLPARAVNILQHMKIKSFVDIPQIESRMKLLEARNSGRKTVHDVSCILEDFHLSFGMSYSEIVNALIANDWHTAKRKWIRENENITEYTENIKPEEATIVLTRDIIEAARTPNGGFTKSQLAAIGIEWPPPLDWIKEKAGTIITPTQLETFKQIKYVKELSQESSHVGQKTYKDVAFNSQDKRRKKAILQAMKKFLSPVTPNVIACTIDPTAWGNDEVRVDTVDSILKLLPQVEYVEWGKYILKSRTTPNKGQTASTPVDIKKSTNISEDRRIGYTVRLFPSQIKGEIIRVKKDEKGIKKLVVKANNGTIIEINDMPYLYEVLRRK